MTKTITSTGTPPPKSKRRDKKRKRQKHVLDADANDETKTTSSPHSPSTATSTHKRRRTSNRQFLNSMVIAISTLVTGEHSEDNTAEPAKASAPNTDNLNLHSYRQVADDCRTNGAKVSAQVHKKVHCLLCTSAAIAQSTQRVRKAIKNHVPLVDVTWLYQCMEQEEKLSFEGFLLQPSSSNANGDIDNEGEVEKKEKKRDKKKTKAKTSKTGDNNLPDDVHDNEPLPDAGWSEPVAVGCCCVCHETGDMANCEWCPDCK